ncbi:MAG: hypothetical protein EHM54_07445 [Nitrospiraceae bacterium]|jgi:hypothetical protein|nr:MAG: hypothetical protein EHM54_07445 [Nitrospiraceae bacterium]
MGGAMNIRNEDIKEILVEIPEGHKHIRTTIFLQDGSELVFQEAAIANITRAYITVKTHPRKASVTLKGTHLSGKKAGYADWQLIEE